MTKPYRPRAVDALTFIVPMFDWGMDPGDTPADFDFLYVPSEDQHAVGYDVFAWNYEEQHWSFHSTHETRAEAFHEARHRHRALCKELRIPTDA